MSRLSDTEWATAKRVCTPKQLQALTYWRDGYGYKRIAIVLGLPRDAARGRVERARDRIKLALSMSDRQRYNRDREAA